MDYKTVNVDITNNQKDKIKTHFKKKSSVSLQLKHSQILNGNDKILLNNRQYKKLEKCKKNNKGIRISLSYKQLQDILKGGFLNEILEFVENNVPYAKKVTPIIRNTIAPVIKENLVPWLKEWIDKELDKVIKTGSGLDENTVNTIKNHLLKEADKKNFNH